MGGLTVLALPGIGVVEPGCDLAELILAACHGASIQLVDHDVLVVAQKVVSKAEGRLLDLTGLKPSSRARALARKVGKEPALVEAVLGECQSVVRATPGHLVVRHRLGMVIANAGIDRSNTVPKEGVVTLLPREPDRSAAQLRQAIMQRCGLISLGVVISDSAGRPFRQGSVGIAIGLAGLSPFRDYRGKKDLFGYTMRTSVEAVADEVASLATLAMGEGDEGTPVIVVRGLRLDEAEGSASQIVRDMEKDLFR